MLQPRVSAFRTVWLCAAVSNHRCWRTNAACLRQKRRTAGVAQFVHCRCYHHLARIRHQFSLLSIPPPPLLVSVTTRPFGMLVVRALRGVLKLRYMVLGGSVAGGYQLNKSYEEFKNGLPDTKWINDMLPSIETVDSFRGNLSELSDNLKNSLATISIDPKLHQIYGDKVSDLREWLQQRLDDAIEAAQSESEADVVDDGLDSVSAAFTAQAATSTEQKSHSAALEERLSELQQELVDVQLKYQRELEKLEVDNKELRKRLLLSTQHSVNKRKTKKSLIEMYSEVLDELSGYDVSYSTQDHLPRVVVVGDQSSGKTSVLEMIARARIFPRGAGEMMTRSPVKVTLCEGPYHIAQFKDSGREFDLSNEQHLKELRKEVEFRMRNSVRGGRTVSGDVISMTVRGPGLQRMVLVDLPGVISTQTVDMAADTRDSIRAISQQHMANPNAIILCVQDGSIDAERSNVTDLVSKMDPTGKRTIFVMTKVDLAEENLTNPDRIRRIMSGKLFPMRALGYFAVVTGRGNKDDSIDQIRDYEDSFFKSSKMFKSGVVSSSQCTTRNLSLAVSGCFWKMVRETVEQQADAFKATRFNLETEWKNNFPRLRELDRDELFERARGEILDEIVRLTAVSSQQWEQQLTSKLWQSMATHVFENIYLPAAQSNDRGVYNTAVDIKLKQWADDLLPRRCVEIGSETLEEEFRRYLARAEKNPEHDPLFDTIKWSAVDAALKGHHWESRASELLRIIQLNTLEDSSVPDKQQWDTAIDFLQESVRQKLQVTEDLLHEMCGPGAWQRWFHWQYRSNDQKTMAAIRCELEKILSSNETHGAQLEYDELSAVRRNVQSTTSSSSVSGSGDSEGTAISTDLVRDVWRPVYRRHFLRRALARATDNRRAFWLYKQVRCGEGGAQRGAVSAAGAASGEVDSSANSLLMMAESECECDDVVLFWRIGQMIRCTANTLRQQIVNREARRLEQRVKEVLEDWSVDSEKKRTLLTGRRVTLAEELKRVRNIQEKLEEFIACLQQEK